VKRYLVWILVMVMITLSVTGFVVPAEAFAYGERTLYQGLRGGDVWQLQKTLETLKYNPGKIDGVFGKGTRQAVINFQKANGLTADGVVGRGTFAKIKERLGQVQQAPISRGSIVTRPATGKVNVGAANLRSGPGVWNKVVTTVKKGTLLTILTRQGNWLKTRLANSTIGWIAAKLVTVDKSAPVSRGQQPAHKPPVRPPGDQPGQPQQPGQKLSQPRPETPGPQPGLQKPAQPGQQPELPPAGGQPHKPDQPQEPQPSQPQPQQPPAAPPAQPAPTTKKIRNITGFYTNPEGHIPGSLAVAQTQSGSLSAIAPFWFRLDRGGKSKISSFDNLDGFTPAQAKEVVREMKGRNVKVLALVHNLLYGSSAVSKNLAGQMLATPDSRKVFIDEVIKLIQEYGFDGVNVDIEDINMADRDKFSLLISEMSAGMKPAGYILTVSVPAKVRDDQGNTWSYPFDYAAIGRSADQVMIMAYDEHGYSSGPGPIASAGWVEAVIKYALSAMPANKIMLGVPAYGFDWTAGLKGPKYLSYDMAMNLAKQTRSTVLWDGQAKVPYFKYTSSDGKAHEVWFENGASTAAKLELVDQYDLKGIALWRLGMEDPAAWQIIGDRIQAEK